MKSSSLSRIPGFLCDTGGSLPEAMALSPRAFGQMEQPFPGRDLTVLLLVPPFQDPEDGFPPRLDLLPLLCLVVSKCAVNVVCFPRRSFIIEEQSFSLCEDLLYGRMSFRGFNPEVEKLMLQMNSKNRAEAAEEEETVEVDVSDEEMARRYETLVGTIGKKFAKKRDRANYEEDENGNIKAIKTKKMFLKPQD